MDAVDLSGDCTAATSWQRFAVMEMKEYLHCITTVTGTGTGTDIVRLLHSTQTEIMYIIIPDQILGFSKKTVL
jgi:hypothetical protein